MWESFGMATWSWWLGVTLPDAARQSPLRYRWGRVLWIDTHMSKTRESKLGYSIEIWVNRMVKPWWWARAGFIMEGLEHTLLRVMLPIRGAVFLYIPGACNVPFQSSDYSALWLVHNESPVCSPPDQGNRSNCRGPLQIQGVNSCTEVLRHRGISSKVSTSSPFLKE